MVEAGLPLVGIRRITVQDTIVTDEASLYLIQPDFAAELGFMTGFAAPNNGGVRLEQTDQFEIGRQLLITKDPPQRLAHHLSDT